jgi:transmembrane sensor
MNARDDLWNEAMALLLTWQQRPNDETVRAEIRTFCAAGEDHLAAWEEAKRVFLLTGAASAGRRKSAHPRITRRQAMIGAGSMIAAGTLMSQGQGWWRLLSADQETSSAQIHRSTLPDGSQLTLGPDSAARFAFTPSERRIQLLSGAAFCEATPDGRPFVCASDHLSGVTSSGTFELRTSSSRHDIAVATGELEVEVTSAASTKTLLRAGDWMSVSENAGHVRRGRRDPANMAAWRRKQLIAEEERVADVIAEIGRWKQGRILIPERSLREEQVSGLFDLSNPDAALQAVVAPFSGRVRSIAPRLTVITTI